MKRVITQAESGFQTSVQATPGSEWVFVVTATTLAHERKFARIGVMRAWCGSRYGGETKQSFARSVASLISDVHSPFDYSPVHARWDVIY